MGVEAIKTEDQFTKTLQSAGDKLVVVDFYATWCGPCKMIAPKIENMSGEFSNVVFIKVDVDELDAVSSKYGVEAMPTFLFFKNETKIDTVVGASEAKIRETVKKHM